jgi:hypothetical protein
VTKPSTRTTLALAAIAVLAVIVATIGVVAVTARHANRPDPQITAYAHGRSVTVPPYLYCTITQADESGRLRPNCRESDITVTLDTPPGSPLQLSLPRQLADAPWVMVREYALPDRTKVRDVKTYRDFKAGTMAVTVPSQPAPDLRLVGVEMQLVMPTRDEAGNESFAPYQAWSIRCV